MPDLKLTIERTVEPTEIAYLVHGTGVFGWAPWWQDIMIGWAMADGSFRVVDDACNNTTADCIVKVMVDDPDEEEGSGITKTFTLTLQDVCDAATKAFQHLSAETVRDMVEDLGLADAEGADITMQYACFGKVIYG